MTINDFMIYSYMGNMENIIVCNLNGGDTVDVYKGEYSDIPSKYDYAEVESFEFQTELLTDGRYFDTYLCFNIDIEERYEQLYEW